MNIITDAKLISRNAKIGVWGQIIGLVILAAGLYLSFSSPERIGPSLIIFAFGFLISQTGMYFWNRWSRRPRPDEMLDKALKGLDRQYTLYHYSSPIPHLLVGPAGVWALLPRNVKGRVSYNKARNRWRHKGGGLIYKLFGQEGMGRPDLDAVGDIQRIYRILSRNMQDEDIPEINAILIFTAEKIDIQSEGSPIPALPAVKLKNFIREQAKQNRLSKTTAERLNTEFKS